MDCNSLFESTKELNYPRHLSISLGCGVGLLSRWGLPAWVRVLLAPPFVRVPLPPPFVRVPLPPPFIRVPLPPRFVGVGVGAGGCGVGLLSRLGLPAWVRFPLPPLFVRFPLPPLLLASRSLPLLFASRALPLLLASRSLPLLFASRALPLLFASRSLPRFVHDIRSCPALCRTLNDAETRVRTGDLQIFGLTLSQLSYRGRC